MYTARKMIKSDTIYNFLETSFRGVANSLKDQGMLNSNNIIFDLYKDQADYDGTINVPVYADDDASQRKNVGLFRFIGGQVDPSQIVNVYLQRFSLEILAFDEYRDDIRNILTTYASSIDGRIYQMTENDDIFALAITVTEFPIISETLDANGADKFIASIIIDILIYQDLVHADGITFMIDGVKVPYKSISFNRKMIDPVPDLEKAYQNRYVPTKSVEDIEVSGLYQNNQATSKVIDWIFDETRLQDVFRVFYTDNVKVKTGVYLMVNDILKVDEGQLLSYSFTLLPYYGVAQTHYGVLAKNGLGTNEYEIGATVQLSTELEGFVSWDVESGQTLELLEGTTLTNNIIKFVMPNSNVIIAAKTE
jgi:hypothetical protein